MAATVASTGSAASGFNITSFTLAGVTVQPNQLLVVFVTSIDGAGDFDTEDVQHNSVSMTRDANVTGMFNSFQVSCWSAYNSSGSALTGDIVVDWNGTDVVSRTGIVYAIVDNAHPTAYFHLSASAEQKNNDSPAVTITPTIDNTLVLTGAVVNTDNELTWTHTRDEMLLMQAVYRAYLCELSQGTAAATTNTATVAGSPGTADTLLLAVSVAPGGSTNLVQGKVGLPRRKVG